MAMSAALQDTIKRIQSLTSEQAASYLLQKHKGDPRAAEVEAWELYDYVAGGTWGMRPKPTDGAQMASLIVTHILAGTEDPPVARTEVRHFSRKAPVAGVLAGVLGGSKEWR